MTRSRTVLVWHISSTTYPIRPDAFERAGLNLDQIVSIEPEHVSLPRPGGQFGTPLAVSRVYVAAQSGVYTHKNDSYDASRYNKPEVEVRGEIVKLYQSGAFDCFPGGWFDGERVRRPGDAKTLFGETGAR